MQDPAHFSDVVCSFCGRHNREVRVVTNDAGLVVCQVCVDPAQPYLRAIE